MIHQILSKRFQALRWCTTCILHESTDGPISPTCMWFTNAGDLDTVVDPAVIVELIDVARQFARDFSGALGALTAAATVDAEIPGVEGIRCSWLGMSHDIGSGYESESGGEEILHYCGLICAVLTGSDVECESLLLIIS
jgi:hypothetical protein